jgi:REP element-mobilizing transposase RayT
MPRQPRLDAPGAVHHVMIRGIERRAIFVDDVDRSEFRDRLCEVIPDCGASSLATAFMSNHVHLVLRSGDTPLSRLMSRLNTSYAVRFNRRHERVGYLFQNRFKSRLVKDEGDLQGLLRYVHLNPIRGGLVADLAALERYPWSSHGALMGRRRALPFEDVSSALSLFSTDSRIARDLLRSWMEEGLREAIPEATPTDRAPSRSSLVLRRAPEGERHDLEGLIEAVCRHFSTRRDELTRGARHTRASQARAVICHVAVARWRVPSSEVSKAVGVSAPAVSQALRRGAELSRELDLDALPVRRVT